MKYIGPMDRYPPTALFKQDRAVSGPERFANCRNPDHRLADCLTQHSIKSNRNSFWLHLASDETKHSFAQININTNVWVKWSISNCEIQGPPETHASAYPSAEKIAAWKKEFQESWTDSSPSRTRYPTRRSAAKNRPDKTENAPSTDHTTRHRVNYLPTMAPENTDMADHRKEKVVPLSRGAIRTERSPTPEAPSTPALIEGLLSFFEEQDALYRQYKGRIEALLRALKNAPRPDVDQNLPGPSSK